VHLLCNPYRLELLQSFYLVTTTDGEIRFDFSRPSEDHVNLQPSLIGEKVALRPLLESDFAELFYAASDPLIWQLHPQSDRYKQDVFEKFFAEAIASKGALAINDLKSGRMIGTSRYYDYSVMTSSVVSGYTFLTREFWGGDYNRDLKKLMVNYALDFVMTTYFHVGVTNFRSQAAMVKLGAIDTGIQEIAVSYAPPKKSIVYQISTKL
jgi:RimJ/RimL family protein N-acetyltransferase